MKISQFFALGVFASYFFLVIGLLCLILRNLPNPKPSNASKKIPIYTFVILTLASFAYTWFCKFRNSCLVPNTHFISCCYRYVQIHGGG